MYKPINQYFNFIQDNDTNDNVEVDYTSRRNRPFIEDGHDYLCAIEKFSLPASEIASFLNTNSNDYIVALGAPVSFHAVGGPSSFDEVVKPISLPLSTNFSYNTFEDVIEGFNRSILASYRDLLKDTAILDANVIKQTGTFSFDKAVMSGTVSHTHTITFTATSSDTKVGYVVINSLQVGLNTATESDSNNNGSAHPHRLYLQSPDGTKCLIYGNSNTVYANAMSFDDSNVEYFESNNVSSTTLGAGSYKPMESFTKFSNGVAQSGNWSLIFESAGAGDTTIHEFHADVAYDIDVIFLPSGSETDFQFPFKAPSLSYIESNNKLALTFHEKFWLSNCFLELSPKLHEVVNFNSVYNSSTGRYRFRLPQITLSTALDSYIQIEQPISSVYALTSIREVQIRSNTLNTLGESDVSSSTPILMSLDVPTNFQKDRIEYVATGNERFYDIISKQSIDDVNLSVFIRYDNGSVVKATLPPHTRFTALLHFKLKNQNIPELRPTSQF